MLEKVNPSIVERKVMNEIISKNYKTPISTYLNKKLRKHFQTIIANDNEYNDLFDIFEYFLSLNFKYHIDSFYGNWAPWGEYHWRKNGLLRKKASLFEEFFNEAEKSKNDWKPIKAGMFDGVYENYKNSKEKLEDFLKNVHYY